MLRLWFGTDVNSAIDVDPVSFYLDYAENYEVSEDIGGNQHITKFSTNSYPVRAVFTLTVNQLARADGTTRTLRSRLIQFIESGVEIIAFEQTTGKAYRLGALKLEPGMPGSKDFSEDSSQSLIAIDAVVTSDGIYTNFDSILSAQWRQRF